MPLYVQLEEKIFGHPKIRRAGELLKPYGTPRAFMFYAASLRYARAYLTDGYVPHDFVDGYVDDPAPRKLADVLVEIGMWHRATAGFQIHDFLDHNDPADTVRIKQAATRERQRRYRAAHAAKGNGRAT